jgi:hypothetical protein
LVLPELGDLWVLLLELVQLLTGQWLPLPVLQHSQGVSLRLLLFQGCPRSLAFLGASARVQRSGNWNSRRGCGGLLLEFVLLPDVFDVFGAFLAEQVDDLLGVSPFSNNHGSLLFLVLMVDVGSLINQELYCVIFLTPHCIVNGRLRVVVDVVAVSSILG